MNSLVLAPLPPAAYEPGRKRPLIRPVSAFLAQLALQYDGIAERRIARGERTLAAARSYRRPRADAIRAGRGNCFSASV